MVVSFVLKCVYSTGSTVSGLRHDQESIERLCLVSTASLGHWNAHSSDESQSI